MFQTCRVAVQAETPNSLVNCHVETRGLAPREAHLEKCRVWFADGTFFDIIGFLLPKRTHPNRRTAMDWSPRATSLDCSKSCCTRTMTTPVLDDQFDVSVVFDGFRCQAMQINRIPSQGLNSQSRTLRWNHSIHSEV